MTFTIEDDGRKTHLVNMLRATADAIENGEPLLYDSVSVEADDDRIASVRVKAEVGSTHRTIEIVEEYFNAQI